MRLNQFRQNKALNESGSQQGQYYLNRFDYFEFYGYPGIKKHLVISIVICLISLHFVAEGMRGDGVISWLVMLSSCYFAYLSGLCALLLYRRVCRYRGYFLFPKKWYSHFYAIRKEVDLDNFDSIATMHHHDQKGNH